MENVPKLKNLVDPFYIYRLSTVQNDTNAP